MPLGCQLRCLQFRWGSCWPQIMVGLQSPEAYVIKECTWISLSGWSLDHVSRLCKLLVWNALCVLYKYFKNSEYTGPHFSYCRYKLIFILQCSEHHTTFCSIGQFCLVIGRSTNKTAEGLYNQIMKNGKENIITHQRNRNISETYPMLNQIWFHHL